LTSLFTTVVTLKHDGDHFMILLNTFLQIARHSHI